MEYRVGDKLDPHLLLGVSRLNSSARVSAAKFFIQISSMFLWPELDDANIITKGTLEHVGNAANLKGTLESDFSAFALGLNIPKCSTIIRKCTNKIIISAVFTKLTFLACNQCLQTILEIQQRCKVIFSSA